MLGAAAVARGSAAGAGSCPPVSHRQARADGHVALNSAPSHLERSACTWPRGCRLEGQLTLGRRREAAGVLRPRLVRHAQQGGDTDGQRISPGGVRINKCLRHVASRRETDRMVEAGRISINGRTALHGAQVHPGDTVEVDGQLVDWERMNVFQGDSSAAPKTGPKQRGKIKGEERFTYIKYYKPAGVVCTTDRNIQDNIIDAIGYPERIFPVGRLDKATTGLLLLTSDGRVVNAVCRAAGGHAKTYWARTTQPITQDQIERLASGVFITTRAQRDGSTKELTARTLPCTVSQLPDGPNCIEITLREGRNRQIRRMLAAVGHEVTELHRVSVMDVSVTGLRPGQWRTLSDGEMDIIRDAVQRSETAADGGTGAEHGLRYHLPQSEEDWAEADRSLRGGTVVELRERSLVVNERTHYEGGGRGREPGRRRNPSRGGDSP